MLFVKKLDSGISGLVMWALFLIVLLQFTSRYFMESSFGWTEEVARYFLVILCYFGAITCTIHDSQIKIDLYKLVVPEKYHTMIAKFNYALSSVCYFWLSYIVVKFAGRTNQVLSSVDIPKNIFVYSVSFSLCVMGLIVTYKLFAKKVKQHD